LHCSFIIPAFNEERYLARTINSVQSCLSTVNTHDSEIIVVDNNSTDQTGEIARKLGCKVVFEPVNQIARARNAGAREASGKTLLFLDADTLLPVETFRNAIDLVAEGKIGAGGALLKFDSHHQRLVSGIVLPYLWNSFSKLTGFFAGCFVFCRQDLFHKVGGFPETHFAGEEIIFCKKLKKVSVGLGFKVAVLKDNYVMSSARKLLWYKDMRILKLLIPTLVAPWVLKRKSFCRFWYDRPS
jgi:glycosyltransferase involved in cell wall biosynthesis